MPTLAIIHGIRFFFYSEEGDEPAHIHVEKGGGEAKYWLKPLRKAYSLKLNPNEQRKIRKLLRKHEDEWARRYCGF